MRILSYAGMKPGCRLDADRNDELARPQREVVLAVAQLFGDGLILSRIADVELLAAATCGGRRDRDVDLCAEYHEMPVRDRR